jgi:hypothetical protein
VWRSTAPRRHEPAPARALLAEQDADLKAYASRAFRTTSQQVDFVCAGGQASRVATR